VKMGKKITYLAGPAAWGIDLSSPAKLPIFTAILSPNVVVMDWNFPDRVTGHWTMAGAELEWNALALTRAFSAVG
jgi:hypothetical protein